MQDSTQNESTAFVSIETSTNTSSFTKQSKPMKPIIPASPIAATRYIQQAMFDLDEDIIRKRAELEAYQRSHLKRIEYLKLRASGVEDSASKALFRDNIDISVDISLSNIELINDDSSLHDSKILDEKSGFLNQSGASDSKINWQHSRNNLNSSNLFTLHEVDDDTESPAGQFKELNSSKYIHDKNTKSNVLNILDRISANSPHSNIVLDDANVISNEGTTNVFSSSNQRVLDELIQHAMTIADEKISSRLHNAMERSWQLENKIKELENENRELFHQIETSAKLFQIADEAKTTMLHQRIDELESELSSNMQKYKNIMKEKNAIQSEIIQLQDTLQIQQEELTHVKAQLQSKTLRISKLESENTEISSKVMQLEEENDKLKYAMSQMRESIMSEVHEKQKTHGDDVESLMLKEQNFKRQVAEMKANHEYELDRMYEDYQKQLQAEVDRIEGDTLQKYSDWQTQSEVLKKTIEQLNEEIRSLLIKNDEAIVTIDNLQYEKSVIDVKLEYIMIERTKLLEKLESSPMLQSKETPTESNDVSEWKSLAETKTAEVAVLRGQIANLQSQCDDMISNLYAEEQSRLKAENRIQELMSELQTSRMKLETISTPLMIQIDNTDTSKVNIPVASVPIDHSSILMDDQDKGMKLVTTLLRIHINKLQNKLSTVKVFAKLREKSLHTKVDDISSQYLQAKKLLFEQQEEFETLKDKYENQSLLLSHTNSDASISDNDVTSTDATKPLSQSHLVYSDKNLDLQPRKSRKQVSRSRNLIILMFLQLLIWFLLLLSSYLYMSGLSSYSRRGIKVRITG